MPTIKFSHKYFKMPAASKESKLAQVLLIDESELSEDMIEYDTAYIIAFSQEGHYPLPKGKLLLLLLIANEGKGWLWCTIRRWTPEKEKYYRSMVGRVFDCVIEEK